LTILGFWTQGFLLVRWALYPLSHTSSPFNSDYFGDMVSHFAQARLEPQSSRSQPPKELGLRIWTQVLGVFFFSVFCFYFCCFMVIISNSVALWNKSCKSWFFASHSKKFFKVHFFLICISSLSQTYFSVMGPHWLVCACSKSLLRTYSGENNSDQKVCVVHKSIIK
jgi:hypothetical protein